jgi:hypothetical protein
LKIRNLGEQVVAGLRACVEITTIEIAPRIALSKKRRSSFRQDVNTAARPSPSNGRVVQCYFTPARRLIDKRVCRSYAQEEPNGRVSISDREIAGLGDGRRYL